MTLLAIAAAGIIMIALIGLAFKGSNPELDKASFREAWKVINQKAQADTTWEIAIVHADKLLDAALRKKHFKGETMGERLISAKNVLSKRQAVWEAHKLRNRLVHEEKVSLDKKKVQEALKGFESALKDLGAL
jgi:uncharacterized protein YutE (UPF0331/DUF86 family)